MQYLYGIIDQPGFNHLGMSGVQGVEIRTQICKNLAAVVSETELTEIDPTRKNVLAHSAVQERLLRDHTLLPMSFGMLASQIDIMKMLENNYAGLENEMKRLSGKIEVEIKAYWDQESIIKELAGGSNTFRDLQSRIKTAASPTEAQNMLIKAGQYIEGVVLDWKARYGRHAFGVLQKVACAARENEPRGLKNILNASFLVEKPSEQKFLAEVHRLDREYQGRLDFKHISPLPPYSFVDLRLEP